MSDMRYPHAESVVAKSSIVDHVLNWAKFKADQQLKKTDGNRRTRYGWCTVLGDVMKLIRFAGSLA